MSIECMLFISWVCILSTTNKKKLLKHPGTVVQLRPFAPRKVILRARVDAMPSVDLLVVSTVKQHKECQLDTMSLGPTTALVTLSHQSRFKEVLGPILSKFFEPVVNYLAD